jgi:hypothetical protein
MDLSKFKLELYDILAVVLPGFLLLCGVWVSLRGWQAFVVSLAALSGTSFTALLLASFPVGHLVQELGDAAIKMACGKRFFKRTRDEFMQTSEGQHVNRTIEQELGFKTSVDGAFAFCLTKIKGKFPRRDTFIATSDFCRSLLVVGFLSIPAVVRLLWDVRGERVRLVGYSIGSLLALSLFVYLAGRRMMRFRELSDLNVFRTYIACVNSFPQSEVSVDAATGAEGED